uniref:Uncharacterized protein At4g10930-like n=1 Tax=Rhizophora mucronata TaxID=61149 RepID=A0A2P2K5J5_RHIMU
MLCSHTANFVADEKILFDANEETVKLTGIKRKNDDVFEAGDQSASATNKAIAKKSRAEGKCQKTTSQGQPEILLSDSDDSQNCATQAEALSDVKLKKHPERDVATPDLMSIVQETGHRASKGVVCRSPVEKSSKERENAAGLRVKKIMRRITEDESSTEVQKLRKEIREAVRSKFKEDIGEKIFDPKLLAAFRHAVAESTTEPVDKLPSLSLKAKRSLLQKGKTRENLTKKIYGNSNGRRKRAWDRDCEVEFWKHRCMRTTKSEKVATLKSVLNVLEGNLEGSDIQQTSESRTTDPILSRLYIADTSVFPRKDDIKPLSALSSISNPIEISAQPISTEKGEKSLLEVHTLKSSDSNGVASILGLSTLHDKVVKDKVPSLKGKASFPTGHPARGPEGCIMAPSGGSNLKSHKEANPQSEDKKVDKKKWALEILARKKAVTGNDAKHEKQEDNAMLKGNYPLLAQLPTDMRPVLAPSQHNKIPISVRQTQLFRLTEHFLKKVNLPEIRRTAETELAVADAINIEKEVADKSKSKLVYLNLCSQELLHRSANTKSVRSMESDSSPQTVFPIDGSEQVSYEIPTDPAVTEALRNAGLLSDSPPSSPYHKMDPPNETENLPMVIKEEGPQEEGHDNILEMDSLPEVDIYGDFEYTLEDEDYIGVTAMEISKLAPEDGKSKMKVVFSTLKSENLSHSEGHEEHRRLENVEPKDSTSLPATHFDGGIASSTLEGITDMPHVPLESLPDQGDEEPSLAECEELYGPDKEPMMNKFPEEESTKPYGLADSKAPVENEVPGMNENFVSGLSDNTILTSAGENSCHGEITSMQVNEKVPRKDNFNTDKQSEVSESVSKKVEAYVKEHIRPLCKSGIITAEQYRWAVAKTTDKVMKYHLNAKNANFLIKEGEKVKKLAEQYVETAQWKEKD